jgi:hypothetical protein
VLSLHEWTFCLFFVSRSSNKKTAPNSGNVPQSQEERFLWMKSNRPYCFHTKFHVLLRISVAAFFFKHNTSLLGRDRELQSERSVFFTEMRENRWSVRVQRSGILGLLVESSWACGVDEIEGNVLAMLLSRIAKISLKIAKHCYVITHFTNLSFFTCQLSPPITYSPLHFLSFII